MSRNADLQRADDGPQLSAVIFDWGGTLTPWHTIDAAAQWAAMGCDEATVARLLAAEKQVWERGRDHHVSGTLAEIFELAEHTPTPHALAALDAWWDPHTYLDPDAPVVFKELRARGLKLGVLSNTVWSRERHEAIFARDGVLDAFDGAVYSSEIAWTKPHPEAFRAVIAAVGVDDPARCVFVGDRLFDDIYGAKAVGMRAVHVPHSDIPREQVGHTEGEPDAVIHRLVDLIPVVDGWL